jgi:hypothetical protein
MQVAPASQQMGGWGIGAPDVKTAMNGANLIYIQQHVDLLDGCCEQKNTYHAHQGNKNGPILWQAWEESGCCERVCCHPNHGVKLHFQTVPDGPVVNTFQRPGCCSGKPCLQCCAFADPCRQQAVMHQGMYAGDVGDQGGWGANTVLFNTIQASACESPFKPRLDTRVGYQREGNPLFTVTGPPCFGGCSALCIDATFGAEDDGGAVGHVKKLAPQTFCECLKECCTDADSYELAFSETATPDQKLAMVSSAFLADYMLFEADRGPCYWDGDQKACHIILCYMYCCGMIVPCKIILKVAK